jgi:hypothetical protein
MSINNIPKPGKWHAYIGASCYTGREYGFNDNLHY